MKNILKTFSQFSSTEAVNEAGKYDYQSYGKMIEENSPEATDLADTLALFSWLGVKSVDDALMPDGIGDVIEHYDLTEHEDATVDKVLKNVKNIAFPYQGISVASEVHFATIKKIKFIHIICKADEDEQYILCNVKDIKKLEKIIEKIGDE
jgi:hypothetical protein